MSLEDTLYPLLKIYEAAPQPVKSLAGRAYRAIPSAWRYGQAYVRFQQESRDVETWDAATIRQYQIKALRESLVAAGKAPFYAQQFAARGLDPARFEALDQLTDYPLLTKQDLLQHREAMVNPEFDAAQRLYITTGGSSGVPVGFYLHKGVSRPKEQAYLEAQWSRRGYRLGDRVAVLRGGVTSGRADGGICSFDATRNWLILSSYHLTPERLPEYVAALNRFRPQHLHAYPSAALLLMHMGVRLDFQLTSLLCGSERLGQEHQRQLEQHFGAPVLQWYGHSERVVLAAQGRRSNALYFCPTYGFVELGTPDAAGNCEIIGTSFHNHVMPLVRYRTGDHARLLEDGAPEFAWPAIGEVIGRDYEFLIGHGGRRVSLTAVNLHEDFFTQLLALQFRQTEPGSATVCYVPVPGFDAATLAQVKKALQRKLGDDFTLQFEQVAEVERTPSGKHRWLITNLKDGGKI